MTPFQLSTTIWLLVVCMLLASGCTVSKISPPIPSTTQIPTTSQIHYTPAQPSIYWIKIDPISDKQKGDIFTITATTNLSIGDNILIEVYPPLPVMQAKSVSNGKFGGARGTTKVISGNNGNNSISFIVNSSEFYPVPDEYIVTEGIYQNSTGRYENENIIGYALFNITSKGF
jgi:hypothetical protein